MPRPPRLQLAPLPDSDESVGQRLPRLRRERGYTQTELAEKIGLIQALVSDYERDKLRLNADLILRFAAALEVTTDELLLPANGKRRPARNPAARCCAASSRSRRCPRTSRPRCCAPSTRS